MPSLQDALENHRAGNLPAAEQAYRAVLRSAPQNADALSLLGVVLEAQGRGDEALAYIRQAIALDPQAPLFRVHLGNVLLSVGHATAAVEAFKSATRMQPTMAEAHYNLGNALRRCGSHDEAINAYQACLQLTPHFHLARNNLALELAATRNYGAALNELRRVATEDPRNLAAYINLATVADQAGEYSLSLQAAESAIALDPHHAEAMFVLGVVLNRLQREGEAAAVYERLLTIAPTHHRAWDNLGQTHQALGQLDAAATCYRQACAVAPEDAESHYHLALLQLLQSDLRNGFRAYAWRWRAVPGLKRLAHPAPVWDGVQPLKGRTILVADEQGFGDCLMFCRYLLLLRQQGARVIYACRVPLLPLLASWSGADRVIALQQADTVACDCQCSLLDLPYFLGTTATTIPQYAAYLTAEPDPIPAACSPPDHVRAGIVWAGNPLHKHDRRRSIPFSDFVTVCGVPGVRYFNLMRPQDLRATEAEMFAMHHIVDLGATIHNFADTARAIAALDVVLTVDTSVAHLAGALGKPVWILLPFAPDWRWQTGRTDSPWYPSARLYRQHQIDAWGTVLDEVRRDLAALTGARGGA